MPNFINSNKASGKMEVNVETIYKYVKANMDQMIILGVFLMVFGVAIGLSFATVVSFNDLVIAYILLFGIFPIGVFLLVYVYYIRFYNNPKILFIKCVALVIISDIFFCLMAYIQTDYYWLILYFIFILGVHFMNKGKSKQSEKLDEL